MKKIIACLLVMVVAISGCSQEAPTAVGAYTTVIDKLYNEDAGLNSDIKYIAVDTSEISNLSEDEVSDLLKEVEKYGFTVLNMTHEKLKQEGYIKDLYFEEGIFFKIKDEKTGGNTITMDASKFRSGTGAIGYTNLKVEFKNGNWEVTDPGTAWIS